MASALAGMGGYFVPSPRDDEALIEERIAAVCGQTYVCRYGDDEYYFIYILNGDGTWSGCSRYPKFSGGPGDREKNKYKHHHRVFDSDAEANKAGRATGKSYFLMSFRPGQE